MCSLGKKQIYMADQTTLSGQKQRRGKHLARSIYINWDEITELQQKYAYQTVHEHTRKIMPILKKISMFFLFL